MITFILQAVGEEPVKPWSWNLPLELFVWLMVIIIGGGAWLWTTAGKDRKNLPDVVGRNIEDFAGVTQEGNAPIPLFLLVFYLVLGLFMIGYPIVTMVFNYNY